MQWTRSAENMEARRCRKLSSRRRQPLGSLSRQQIAEGLAWKRDERRDADRGLVPAGGIVSLQAEKPPSTTI